MTRFLTLALLLAAAPAAAQEQQAGNDASTNTDATFQALIDKCDDVDALMLRARIRVQMPYVTEEAAAQAQEMLDQGFATCGEGDLEGAKATLTEALAIAEAGATENFGTDAAVGAEATSAAAEDAPAEDMAEDDKKPWWRIW